MSIKIVGQFVGLAAGLACASQVAVAQDFPKDKQAGTRAAAQAEMTRATLEQGLAHLAVKAAFSPQAQPSREELIGVLLLMSLRNGKGHGA